MIIWETLQLFFVSHLTCFTIFVVLLILHCPDFWKWICVPLIIYCMEIIWKYIKINFGSQNKSVIEQFKILQSKWAKKRPKYLLAGDENTTYHLQSCQVGHQETSISKPQAWWLCFCEHSRHCKFWVASIHHQFGSWRRKLLNIAYPSLRQLDKQAISVFWSHEASRNQMEEAQNSSKVSCQRYWNSGMLNLFPNVWLPLKTDWPQLK